MKYYPKKYFVSHFDVENCHTHTSKQRSCGFSISVRNTFFPNDYYKKKVSFKSLLKTHFYSYPFTGGVILLCLNTTNCLIFSSSNITINLNVVFEMFQSFYPLLFLIFRCFISFYLVVVLSVFILFVSLLLQLLFQSRPPHKCIFFFILLIFNLEVALLLQIKCYRN